jgi:hypothetical protein
MTILMFAIKNVWLQFLKRTSPYEHTFFLSLENVGELRFVSLRKQDKNPQHNNTTQHKHTHTPGDDQYNHDLNTHNLGPERTRPVGYQSDL